MRALVRVAVALWLAGEARAQSCVIEGRPPGPIELRVAAEDTELFVTASGIEVAVEPGHEPGGATRIAVRGALRFAATLLGERVPLLVRAPIDAAEGVLHLQGGLALAGVRQSAERAIADVELAPGVTARGVDLPCAALALSPEPGGADRAPPVEDRAPWGTPRTGRLELRARAGAPIAVRLRVEAPFDLALQVVERRGTWARVRWRGQSGAALDGWTAQASIRRLGHDEKALGRDPPNLFGELRPPTPEADPPGAWRGTARVAAGSAVYAAPGGGAWATIAREQDFTIVLAPGATHAQLVEAPGLVERGAGGLRHAWVVRAAVRLPAP